MRYYGVGESRFASDPYPQCRKAAIPQYFYALVFALVLASMGCGGPSFNFEGHWSGKRNLPRRPGDDDVILNTISKVDVDVKPDGKFDLFDAGMPKSGRYRTEGLKAFLKVETIMERPVEEHGTASVEMNKEIQLMAQKDGSIVFSDPGAAWQEPVKLVREKGEAQPGK